MFLYQRIAQSAREMELDYVPRCKDLDRYSPRPTECLWLMRVRFFVCRLYSLRWFTPIVEIPLCGHGTVGAAASLLEGAVNPALLIPMLRHCGSRGMPEIKHCCRTCNRSVQACPPAGEGVHCTEIHFQTKESGLLTVKRSADGLYHLSLPYLHPDPPSSAVLQLCDVSSKVLRMA